MMTEEQKARVFELKERIEETAATPRGAPIKVREAVLELAQELGRSGVTARALAAALGLHETTLSRWKRDRQAVLLDPTNRGNLNSPANAVPGRSRPTSSAWSRC